MYAALFYFYTVIKIGWAYSIGKRENLNRGWSYPPAEKRARPALTIGLILAALILAAVVIFTFASVAGFGVYLGGQNVNPCFNRPV